MADYEDALVFALVLHDVGWVTMRPEVGIPALAVGFGLQTRILLHSCGEMGLDFANQMAIFCWLIGNNIWSMSEFIWEEPKPAGFLSAIDALAELDKRWYSSLMRVANVIMLAVCLSLLAVYSVRWVFLSCRRYRRRSPAREEELFHASSSDLLVTREGNNPNEIVTPLPCLPMRIYQELFIIPWLVMDTIWVHINYRSTLEDAAMRGAWLPIGAAAGTVAIALQTDSLRRNARSGLSDWTDLAVSLAELLWVLGNLVWMLEDLLTENGYFPGWCVAVALFISGDLLTVSAMMISQSRVWQCHRASRTGTSPQASMSVTGWQPNVLLDQGELELSRHAVLP
mmetsp:Transcript_66852/g.185135  ORF Transcript_66852/g.185135 Transcript_66852/m.185135 type:complete len:341 (-) Transcript_66852:122-1144(-)